MRYTPHFRHRFVDITLDRCDSLLDELHEKKCEIVNLFAIKYASGHAGIGIHYREPIIQAVPKSPDEFRYLALKIYELYPKKQGKKVGVQKLAKIFEKGESFERLEQATKDFAEYHKNTNKQYIPFFSTFIQQHVWDFMDREQKTENKYDFIEDE